MKILLVEDDENLGYLLQDSLNMAGYVTDLLKDGEAGWQAFQQTSYDICVLDVMMPKKDGFALATAIRQQNQKIPIVFLTAKSLKEDRIKGFKVGGDDYITKPFSIEEFLLRIEAILKRLHYNSESAVSTCLFADSTLDCKNLRLLVAGESRNLTLKEMELLRYLGTHPNTLLSREDIQNAVWADDSYFVGRSMDVFISRLRKYLKGDPKIAITNVHGVGYRFEINES